MAMSHIHAMWTCAWRMHMAQATYTSDTVRSSHIVSRADRYQRLCLDTEREQPHVGRIAEALAYVWMLSPVIDFCIAGGKVQDSCTKVVR